MYVVCLGNLNIDLIVGCLERFPDWGTETKIDSMEFRIAGAAGNYALSLSKLGVDCILFSNVGNDLLGKLILDELKKKKINAQNVRIDKEKTCISISVLRKLDRERCFLTYFGHLTLLDEKVIDWEIVKDADILCYLGYFVLPKLKVISKKILAKAQSFGVKTILDTGWDPNGWNEKEIEKLGDLLKNVDFFSPNFDEGKMIAKKQKPEEIVETLLEFGCGKVALKMGEKGCIIADRNRLVTLQGFKVEAKDTTGAGDAFNAGITYGILKRYDLEKMGLFANAVAALTISSLKDRYPTIEKVKRFEKNMGIPEPYYC